MTFQVYISRMRIRVLSAALAAVIAASVAAPAWADTFTLSAGQKTPLKGVSPFAEIANSEQDRVFYGSTDPGGWAMALCTGASCTTPQQLPMDFGNDFTSVTLTDGSQRAYFVTPGQTTKSLSTALVSYDSAGTPQLGAITDLGISSPTEQRAWGVPDSVVLPDGRVRLYWVAMPSGGESTTSSPSRKQLQCLAKSLGKKRVAAIGGGAKPSAKDKKAMKKCKVDPSLLGGVKKSRSDEVILSATSTDASGTSFAQDPGYRFTGGYVDSEIVRAATGDWIALVSTGPGDPPQRLFAATSKDGLSWKVDGTPLTPASANALDPTAIPSNNNMWKVYWSESPAATPFENHTIVVGTLRR